MRLPVPGPRDVVSAFERGAEQVEAHLGAVPRALVLLERAETLIDGASTGLMDSLTRSLIALQPMLETLADTTRPDEVRAHVGLVDQLPEPTARMEGDVLPILVTRLGRARHPRPPHRRPRARRHARQGARDGADQAPHRRGGGRRQHGRDRAMTSARNHHRTSPVRSDEGRAHRPPDEGIPLS